MNYSYNTDVILSENKPVYICHIDDYATKIKNTDEYYINLIEKLKEEIKLRDNYISQVIGTINKKLYKKIK